MLGCFRFHLDNIKVDKLLTALQKTLQLQETAVVELADALRESLSLQVW